MPRILAGFAVLVGSAMLAVGAAAQDTGGEGKRSFEVFFDFNKSDLTAAAVEVIAAAAENEKSGHVTSITVTGHTDTVGSVPHNLVLSEKRAAAVRAQLIADGVTPDLISATGVGKDGLLVVTADGVREPQNRRAEIVNSFGKPLEPAPVAATPTPPPAAAPAGCTGTVDPYKNYACLDAYLGTDVLTRLANYYRLEWGESGPPTDPNAPSAHREGWPPTPQMTPPMPFTEWPYGGVTPLGVTLPGSVDSPFMVAIADTSIGQWMNDTGLQLYGWVDPGANVSTNTVKPGGNAPIAYAYTPNTVQLDQLVLYLDRFPDTVQTDHIDWGLRLSGIYGENYRYTTSYGVASYQLLKKNYVNGYDFPMVYGELYLPQIADGLMLRLGRYISLPDIEAQLAPNNYMYTHSMTYTFDNYTNEGLQSTLAITNDLLIQFGVSIGTEAAAWHWGEHVANPDPNPLYPLKTFLKDPGAKPSFTFCARYTWNDGNDNIYPCADAINNGVWGYNNVQWYGTTIYHKFNDQWHISFEFYDNHADGIPNLNNPTALAAYYAGGTPFSPQYMPYNAPSLASCHSSTVLRCRGDAVGTTFYLNYSPDPLDNFSFRPEYFDDPEGWRSGVRTEYLNWGLSWQHWLSPQIELRPEIDYDRSLSAKAFDGNSNAGIAPSKNFTVLAAGDIILHF